MSPAVSVRYFAGARAAAGITEEQVSAATLGELRDRLARAHGTALQRILTGASFLVDGVSVQDPHHSLAGAATVDVLPPFAGG